MPISLLGNMVVGGMRFWPVVTKVFRKHGLSWAVAGLTASEIYSVVQSTAPESDEADIREVSNQLARMIDEDEVLWPTNREGAKIHPAYLTINMDKGTAWFHSRYNSFKTVEAARRRGRSQGFRGSRRRYSDNTNIYRGT